MGIIAVILPNNFQPSAALYEGDEATAVAEFTGQGRILDCGCGTGRIAQAVRPTAQYVCGIELSPASAAAAEVACDRVLVGSVTDPAVWEQFAEETFDTVLFIHVLEHLTSPEAAIRLAVRRLRSNGRVIVALPNVANWRVRWNLLRGRWDYLDEGIMDRTHVRFYTFKTATELLAGCGLVVRTARVYFSPAAGWAGRRWLVRTARRIAPLLFAHSFLFESVPAGAIE